MKTEYKTPTSVRDPEESTGQNICRPSTMIKCCGCSKVKDETCFYKRANGSFHKTCKECQLKAKKEYYRLNSETVKAKRNKYYKENTKKVRQQESKYRKSRRANDPAFKLLTSMRNHIYQTLFKGKKFSTRKYYGCNEVELKDYLESKFLPGMTWENYGKHGWHIDHIFPLSRIDLADENSIKKYLHYSNLQPLWATDNQKKSNKI